MLVDDGAVVTTVDGALALVTVDEAQALAGAVATGDASSGAEVHGVGGRELGGREVGGHADHAGASDVDAPDAADDAWLLLGRDDEGTTFLARRVLGRRAAPPTGSASDVLVHAPASADEVPPAAVLPPGTAWSPLRVVGAALSARDAGLATAAVALDAWHARHPRCPRCGAVTVSVQAGWVRRCVADGSEHYPRTDPAVIMAVLDEQDRILLAHAAAWPAGRWSTLAGFVEPGESLEHAVRREVAEETGVVVGDVEYRGSQPWPFPASLMVAFRARARSTAVTADGVEVLDARWFSRDDLRAAVAAGEVVPPGPASIARALVEDWLGEPLREPTAW
ncbi:NAD(+) diphosphatase [Cellulomonas fimi]|nr:NAD(+) diphosphatase [Cellulomonas fimi]